MWVFAILFNNIEFLGNCSIKPPKRNFWSPGVSSLAPLNEIIPIPEEEENTHTNP